MTLDDDELMSDASENVPTAFDVLASALLDTRHYRLDVSLRSVRECVLSVRV
jgi:hypothetical protein